MTTNLYDRFQKNRLALLSLCMVACRAAGQSPPTYTVQFITPDLSAINAAAMNQAGDVVGTSTTGSGAWVSRGGAPAVLLPLPPGAQFAFANDISDTGVIVGSVGPTSSLGFGKAVAWIPDGAGGYTIQQFGTLPGHVTSDATAVNNVGDIVGYSSNGTFRLPVLFIAPGEIQDLSPTGIFDPIDVNDERVVIDHSFTCKRLDLDTMQVEDLGTAVAGEGEVSYVASRGEAINEAGQVAGSVRLATSTNCDLQAARFTDETGWEVLSSCGSTNSAWDINDLGDVIMRLNVALYVRYESIGTFLVEDLIQHDVGHWYVINGFGIAINNARQLAVPAHNDVTNEAGIILLTPVSTSGDVNGDGQSDEQDRLTICSAMGASSGDRAYVAAADLNGDKFVDHLDLAMFNELMPPCLGDVVSSATFQPPPDGAVDAADLAYLLGAWGAQPSCADFVTSTTFMPPPDGVIDAADLAALLGAWGECE